MPPPSSIPADQTSAQEYQADSSWTRDLLILVVLFGLLLGFRLGSYALANPDEGRYAEIPREMLASGDWVTPHLNGVNYFEKPPLMYWAVAVCQKAFGQGEWASRAIPALFSLAGILLTYATARQIYGRRAGLASATVLGTSLLYFGLSRILILDMGVTVLMSATLCCFILGVRAEPGLRRRLLFYGLYASAALATLTKGLIGFLVTGAVMFLWLLICNQWRRLRPMHLPTGILLFLAIALPWHLLAAARAHGHSSMYPLAFMVSDKTKDRTIAYLHSLKEWDEIKGRVIFVEQTMLPGIEEETGEAIKSEVDRLNLGGNGHGDAFDYVLKPSAKAKGLVWSDKEKRFVYNSVSDWFKGFGVEVVQYLDIDNTLKPVADSYFVGKHILSRDKASEAPDKRRAHVSLGLIKKTKWDEGRKTFTDRLGNVVIVNGQKESVDYSDATDAINASKYGDPSIRIVTLDSLENSEAIPWSVAHKTDKKVTVSAAGGAVKKEVKILKFERSSGSIKRYGAEIGRDAEDVFAPIKKPEDVAVSKTAQSNVWKKFAQKAFPEANLGNIELLELPRSARYMEPAELRRKLTECGFEALLSGPRRSLLITEEIRGRNAVWSAVKATAEATAAPASSAAWTEVTSPETTIFEPAPMRVRNIFICATVVFWARRE